MAYIAGAYTGAYTPSGGGSAVTLTTEDGFEVLEQFHGEDIRTDNTGDAVVDRVNRAATTRLRFTGVEADKMQSIIYDTYDRGNPLGKVGTLVSSECGSLVLTPKAGTAAATADGTWTFHKIVVDGDISLLLSSRHRKIPVTFLCLADAANSNKTYTVAAAV